MKALVDILGDAAKKNKRLPSLVLENMAGPVTAALSDKARSVRSAAAAAGRQLSYQDISPGSKEKLAYALLRATGDQDLLVRLNASMALGKAATSDLGLAVKMDLVSQLLSRLKSPVWQERVGAARTLGTLSTLNVYSSLPGKSDITPGMKELMVEPLTTASRNSDWRVRAAAVRALGELSYSDIAAETKHQLAAPIIERLTDKKLDVRVEADRALTTLVRAGVYSPLIEKALLGK